VLIRLIRRATDAAAAQRSFVTVSATPVILGLGGVTSLGLAGVTSLGLAGVTSLGLAGGGVTLYGLAGVTSFRAEGGITFD
jgi:hypothetical protein